MEREVFQSNKILTIGIPVFIFIVFAVITIQTDFPIWVLPIVMLISCLIIFSAIKTKIVVENGVLGYEKLTGGEEIELEHVAQIVTREVETIVNREREGHSTGGSGIAVGSVRIGNNNHAVDQERTVEKIVYVLDDKGRTFFSFPANTIRLKDRNRFTEAIQAFNANIDIF